MNKMNRQTMLLFALALLLASMLYAQYSSTRIEAELELQEYDIQRIEKLVEAKCRIGFNNRRICSPITIDVECKMFRYSDLDAYDMTCSIDWK